MTEKIDISVLLPTRGRPGALEHCLTSLLNKARSVNRVEVLLAFDNDDLDHLAYFQDVIVPWLKQIGVSYTAFKFPRLGYLRLNEYLNELATHARGDWMFFWNDDADMVTSYWDDVVASYTGQLRLLRATTNHEHPYAIFPIVPAQWVKITGHLSPHQINDAWVSQIGFMLDIVETIPVHIHHDRFDLTGQNNDRTFQERKMLENLGAHDTRDFNHANWRKIRINEAIKLAEHIERTENRLLTHFRQGLDGKINVWEKMLALDVKKQMRMTAVNDK
jgi:hypothetical protein